MHLIGNFNAALRHTDGTIPGNFVRFNAIGIESININDRRESVLRVLRAVDECQYSPLYTRQK